MNKIRIISAAIFISISLFLFLLAPGCSTNSVTTAYKVEAAGDITVGAAMTAWGAYVAAAHPSAEDEMLVYQAFQAWKTADLAAIAATESLALAPTNTPATAQAALAATAALSAAGSNLIAVVQSFGVNISPASNVTK